MKETILALLLVLVIVGGIALGVHFLFFDTAEEAPATEPTTTAAPTQETEPTTTEPPTEPTTTEPPTEPEPQLFEADAVFIVNGVTLSSFVAEDNDVIVTPAADYLQALGLDSEGSAHLAEKSRLEVSDDAICVDGTAYGSVYGGELYLPVEAFAEAFGYPLWVDEENGDTYITPGAKSFELPENVNVPVLMYHAVSDYCWGYDELFVSPSTLEQQLQYLVENDYDCIWFEDLAYLDEYEKPVILTFDDGYDDNYTDLFPLLQKYGVKATIFIIGQDVSGINHKMNEAQMREMADSGLVSLQAHGYTHHDMDAMGEETLIYELSETQKVVARITGRVPYVLCYPTGKYSSLTIEVAERYYNFGLKMTGGLFNTSVDSPYKISRYYIARSTDLYTFAYYISPAATTS